MSVDFTVYRIALHWMDKAKGTLQKATSPVDLAAFKREDLDALRVFFSDHLRRVWDAQEGSNNISAAKFQKSSEILKDYKELVANSALLTKSDKDLEAISELPAESDKEPEASSESPAKNDKEPAAKSESPAKNDKELALLPKSGEFLISSQRMADSLFKEAPTNSSPGILMTLWFLKKGDARQFLALFKMDPGRSNKITLQSNQVLLNLAVQHIDQALPDTGDRVLKWAVTPHPTRPYDVKVRDSQGKQKAIYFMKFLGCEAGKTEKEQIREVMKVLPEGAMSKLIKETKPLPNVDLEAIGQSRVLTPPQIAKVKERFPKELDISSRALQTLRKTLKLNNGIIIKGPLEAMRGIRVNRLAKNDVELVIRTTGFTESYD